MKAVLVALAGAGVLAADPPRPEFPEPQHYVTDWTMYNYTVNPKNPETFEGDGRLQRDVSSQQFSDRMRVYEGHSHHPFGTELLRFLFFKKTFSFRAPHRRPLDQ